LQPHTYEIVDEQLVGFVVQTPSSWDEHAPVFFLQYSSLSHVLP
jgi:hypothetical protein